MGWNDFSLAAVGCWYENDDGSSRQLELQECQPGDLIELVRQPNNPHDHLAVAIVTANGTCVGFLKRDRAAWIAPKIDRGMPVNAIVERVKGIDRAGATLGLVLRINMEGDTPTLPGQDDEEIAPPSVNPAVASSTGKYAALPGKYFPKSSGGIAGGI